MTVRPEMSEMQNETGNLVDNDGEICNILGRYFKSVFSARSNEQMPDMESVYDSEIKNVEITRKDIQTRLEKLSVYKSPGPDNVHPFVLQRTASTTSIPLEKNFRLSLSTGVSKRLEKC